MAPRGLSREEKRTKMLEIFHDSADFYTLKELEKIAPKQKGIVMQSVKEIVDELKNDGLVTCEKIGTGNYYWSFPSAAGAQKQGALDRISKEAEDLESKIGDVKDALAAAEIGREDTPERRKLLTTLKDLQAQTVSLKSELDAFGAADPLKYEKKREAVEVAKRAASRWTDNLWICVSVFKNAGVEEDTIRQYLGLSEDWDDLDTVK